MFEGHYFRMNTFVLSFALYYKDKALFCNVISLCFKLFPPVPPCYMQSEGWPVVGFCPHVGSTGVFGMESNNLDPIRWSLKELFSAMDKAIRLYGLNALT